MPNKPMKLKPIRFHEAVESAIEAHAAELGETFNEYVTNAALKRLPKEVRATLPKPQPRGRPRKPQN